MVDFAREQYQKYLYPHREDFVMKGHKGDTFLTQKSLFTVDLKTCKSVNRSMCKNTVNDQYLHFKPTLEPGNLS